MDKSKCDTRNKWLNSDKKEFNNKPPKFLINKNIKHKRNVRLKDKGKQKRKGKNKRKQNLF